MISKIKISSIKGAEYNPRLLSEQAEKDLINSINRFGQIKPIIVRKENMTIVAGHQRTKIMKNIGYDMVDAIFLEDVKLSDEATFFSGRPVSTINDLKKSTSKSNTMYFKDANNFTANYLKGYWFYQKFHDINQQMELVEYFDETYLKHNKDVCGFRYMVNNSKVYSKEQYHEAIKYELTLPLPNSNNYNLYNENIDFIDQIINLKINGN